MARPPCILTHLTCSDRKVRSALDILYWKANEERMHFCTQPSDGMKKLSRPWHAALITEEPPVNIHRLNLKKGSMIPVLKILVG